jgi:ribosome-binding factor A
MTARARARKLADRIKVIVAETLEHRVKDPRLGFVTVTDVRITNDLHDATVFYTVLGDEKSRADTAAALESATGVLRSEVGRQTGVRFTPTLAFIPDAVPENARHIEDLLQQAAVSDAQVQARAVGSGYAGDADPYRSDPADEPVGSAAETAPETAPDSASDSEGTTP